MIGCRRALPKSWRALRRTLASNRNQERIAAKIFALARSAGPNHFSPIRSFLIDSGLRQARAASFMQNFFAHNLQRTRTNTVAKIFAIAGGKIVCAASAWNFKACKKALFYRTFCNSRLAGDLQGISHARSVVMTTNDVFKRKHDVSNALAIHMV